jgi:hypothetical protein
VFNCVDKYACVRLTEFNGAFERVCGRRIRILNLRNLIDMDPCRTSLPPLECSVPGFSNGGGEVADPDPSSSMVLDSVSSFGRILLPTYVARLRLTSKNLKLPHRDPYDPVFVRLGVIE